MAAVVRAPDDGGDAIGEQLLVTVRDEASEGESVDELDQLE